MSKNDMLWVIGGLAAAGTVIWYFFFRVDETDGEVLLEMPAEYSPEDLEAELNAQPVNVLSLMYGLKLKPGPYSLKVYAKDEEGQMQLAFAHQFQIQSRIRTRVAWAGPADEIPEETYEDM